MRKTPLEAMLDVMDYYCRRWTRAEDDTDRTRAAEMTLRAATLAAPYVHARKLIVEDETPVAVNVVDRREIGGSLPSMAPMVMGPMVKDPMVAMAMGRTVPMTTTM